MIDLTKLGYLEIPEIETIGDCWKVLRLFGFESGATSFEYLFDVAQQLRIVWNERRTMLEVLIENVLAWDQTTATLGVNHVGHAGDIQLIETATGLTWSEVKQRLGV